MKEKLTIQVHGQVIGHRYEDESVEQATARLLLAAEMEGNNGHARLHLNAVDPSLTELFNDGILRGEAPQDRIRDSGFSLSRYGHALIFAARAHGNQRRKYTNEPYLVHPIAVAGMLADAGFDEDVVIAGVLHDTVEDTSVTFEQIESEFGLRVAGLVREVSAVSKPEDGSREKRKRIDLHHYATACDDAQSVKVADFISNAPSIVEHDPAFAKIYLAEKRALLAVLTRANPNLLRGAYGVLEAGERTNLRDLTPRK